MFLGGMGHNRSHCDRYENGPSQPALGPGRGSPKRKRAEAPEGRGVWHPRRPERAALPRVCRRSIQNVLRISWPGFWPLAVSVACCNQYALFCTSFSTQASAAIPSSSAVGAADAGKLHSTNHLSSCLILIKNKPRFGSASAFSVRTKRPQLSMTFTLFDKERHFTKCRSGCRDGLLNCLS
jgi:hypothetical protein